MEDRKLNEKESLELIARMIQNTRHNLDAGGGNMFLLWGYVGVAVTLGVLLALYVTKNPVCLWGFWALPVVGWPLSYWFAGKWHKEQGAKDYTDRVVRQLWQILGIACCGVALFAILYRSYEVILPLCALFMSLGSLLTGVVIRYTLFSGFPSLGFAWSLVLLFQVITDGVTYTVFVVFIVIILLSLVVPGHVLNYRARKGNVTGKRREE